MKIKIDDKDCEVEFLKIPKNCHIIEDWELCLEVRTNEVLKQIATKGWIFVNTVNGIRSAGFSYNSGGFHVDGYSGTNNYPACSRGVFVEEEREEIKKKENSGWAKQMTRGGKNIGNVLYDLTERFLSGEISAETYLFNLKSILIRKEVEE